jgi:hypothetical protein
MRSMLPRNSASMRVRTPVMRRSFEGFSTRQLWKETGS